jgi:hypothetical protein
MTRHLEVDEKLEVVTSGILNIFPGEVFSIQKVEVFLKTACCRLTLKDSNDLLYHFWVVPAYNNVLIYRDLIQLRCDSAPKIKPDMSGGLAVKFFVGEG